MYINLNWLSQYLSANICNTISHSLNWLLATTVNPICTITSSRYTLSEYLSRWIRLTSCKSYNKISLSFFFTTRSCSPNQPSNTTETDVKVVILNHITSLWTRLQSQKKENAKILSFFRPSLTWHWADRASQNLLLGPGLENGPTGANRFPAADSGSGGVLRLSARRRSTSLL